MNYDIVQLEEEKAPAIFSNNRAPNVTEKYNHFNTKEIIEVAQSVGWQPFKYGQKRRNRTSLEKGLTNESTAHFCTLKPVNMQEPSIFNNGPNNYSAAYPTILITNSHDGTRSLQADLGLIEQICGNGMIIVSDNMANLSWRHSLSNFIDKIKEDFLHLLSYAPWIMKVRNFLCGIPVTHKQATDLAERTIELRYNGDAFSVNPEDIVRARFSEQSQLSAYNVWQNIQRNLIQGDYKVTNKKNLDGVRTGIYKRSPYRKALQIKSFSEERRINKGLWMETSLWLKELGYEVPSAEEN